LRIPWGNPRSDIVVDVTAEGEWPPLRLSPVTCDFGRVAVGDVSFCDIGLANDFQHMAEIAAFDVPAPFAVEYPAAPLLTPVGTSHGVRLSARPSATGVATGSFSYRVGTTVFADVVSLRVEGI
jgi:hypothetical protein